MATAATQEHRWVQVALTLRRQGLGLLPPASAGSERKGLTCNP